ncbi:molecular chaperone HtpG [Actinomycetospora sp. NBRC 106378]|uniref:molecular chaperone HtpG n=1 Tax=Actinomycetospora sp. NBRC 106378 TaxID=3032208 RepID=UPI0024A55007|nr:molecular chaperone HtpG [Actinomycetospora sp. NBRC 106378]GLZ52399.1 chaperone protein HtpG [Actinomycetospora sp. NBRC 106378]
MTETIEFQAEARQLLQLMIHSIYSDKDVFLRELISNASDALDKLRMESYRDKDLGVDTTDLHVELRTDAAARTLTITDNGIGMSRDDVVNLIGTIARSGTAETLSKLREAQASGSEEATAELIGQFGIGFYSSFMVADRVEMTTRRAGTDGGVHWESAGEGTYELSEVADAPQGTSITVHLKAEDAEDNLHDYADPSVVRRIVKRYSDFITWPILLDPSGVTDTVVEGAEEDTEESAPDTSNEPINSRKALWARPRSEVSDEEYAEFYRHVSHDWQEPLETMRFTGEGTFEYQALLFLPAHAPMDLYYRDAKRGVQLYVKRVFVMEDCEVLVPEYLRFVKGVVDAQDLSLNVSREILQQDRQIQLIRKRLVKRVLQTITALRGENAEKYETFWRECGRALKEGLLSDQDNTQAILEASSFASTHDPERLTTLADYVARMPEGQESIYYVTGENRAAVENSPHIEAFRAKGYEVLLLTDQVDEVWVGMVPSYGSGEDAKPFASIAQGDVDLSDDAEKPEGFDDLLTWMTTTLADDVSEVRLSTRLTTSPACLVGEVGGLPPQLEQMMRSMGQEIPVQKRALELNPKHPLVENLRTAHAAKPDDAGIAETASLLHDMALLAEGGELKEPSAFVGKLAQRLAATL